MTDESEDLDEEARPRRKRRGPAKVSRKKLENAALHYLQRFSTPSEGLRRVLMRRVWRSAHHNGFDADEGAKWANEVVAKMQACGFVNDRLFAEGRVRSLLARGKPLRGIRLQLHNKGVGKEIIDEVFSLVEEEDGDVDFTAAMALAKRRRLGPYSTRLNRLERREKEMAAMARAGFDFETARCIIDAETPNDLESVKNGEENSGMLGYFPDDL